MLGAIIGDIAGSRFEFNNTHSKDFELFVEDCFVTDDSIMTLAVAIFMARNGAAKSKIKELIDLKSRIRNNPALLRLFFFL